MDLRGPLRTIEKKKVMKSAIKLFDQSEETTHTEKGMSKSLSAIAMALWVCSLALPAMMFFPERRELMGYEVLGGGWAGVFVMNIAWFANGLFIWTFFEVRHRNRSSGKAVLALLFSLDAFFFRQYPYPFAVGASPVYGYGWGAVVWLMSICVMVAAAGAIEIEKRKTPDSANGENQIKSSAECLLPIGLGLCVLFLVVASYLSYQDHSKANTFEKERLTRLAFKKRAVCTTPTFTIGQPLSTISGPMTVIIEAMKYAPNPFFGPKELVRWGIPVRVGNKDFRLVQDGADAYISAAPAVGPLSAMLYVSAFAEPEKGHNNRTSAKMVESDTGRIVFDQTWREEPGGGGLSCPDFSNNPKPGEQPRILVLEAFGIPDQRSEEVQLGPSALRGTVNRIKAKVINTVEAPAVLARPNRHASVPSAPTIGDDLGVVNQNCPEDVGWNTGGADYDPDGLGAGMAFHIGNRTYYLGSRDKQHAYCAGGSVYLMSTQGGWGQQYIPIQKRALANFKLEWATQIFVDIPSASSDKIKVKSIEETSDGIVLTVVNRNSLSETVLVAPAVALTGK